MTIGRSPAIAASLAARAGATRSSPMTESILPARRRIAPTMVGVTRIPALGPKGEGWIALQVVFIVAIPIAWWWAARTEPDPNVPDLAVWRGIGTVVLVGGLLLIGVSSTYLRRSNAFSALPRPVAAGSLVESGPYRLIRHPLYAGL